VKPTNFTFIDWSVTDSFSGILSGMGKIDTEKGENYFLEFEDGKRVGLSSTIKRALKFARAQGLLELGCKIDFVNDGETKTKAGNNLRLIRVAINDKEIRPEMIDDFESFLDVVSEL